MNFAAIDDRLSYYNAPFQLWGYLKKRTGEARLRREAERHAICDPAAHRADTEQFRRRFLEQIGGLPDAEGEVPALCTGEVVQEGFVIRKMLLEPRPGVKATAHLYLPPLEEGKKAPAILFLCGHSNAGKSVERYQAVAQCLVARGLIVLVLDPTGQGERLNYYDPEEKALRVRPGTGDHEYNGPQGLLLGRSLIRYMLNDAIRAVDFLVAQPQVDASRLGVTGSSGGGMQTSLMLLVEPRLAAAAPATFVTSREAIFDSGYGQDAEQIWPGFCAAGYEHVDLLTAFAPKPLAILSVKYDFFPIEGTRRTVAEARRFWELYGQGEELRMVEDRSVHRYTDTLADAAGAFFAGAFGLPEQGASRTPRILPEADLWVTKSGQVASDFPGAKTIFDENREALANQKFSRKEGIAFLREAVFFERRPVETNLRITLEMPCADVTAYSAFWWSEEGRLNSGILLRAAGLKGRAPGVTIALWEDGSRSITRHDRWIRQEIASGRAVLVLNVAGMGPLEPPPFNSEKDAKAYHGSFYRVCDDLIFLGDSFAALRTYDVLRSLEALREWDGLDADDVRLYLEGPYGIYGALASALEPRLAANRWERPLFSYIELLQTRYYNDRDVKSLIIPGLLRHADWTDLVPFTVV